MRKRIQLVLALFDAGVETYILLPGCSFSDGAPLFAIFENSMDDHKFLCVISSITKIDKLFYGTSLNRVTNCTFNYRFDLFSLLRFIRYRPFLEHAPSSYIQQH